MSRLLLVFTAARRGEAAVAHASEAFQDVAASCEVALLYVVDADRGEHIQECLSGRGFVGLGPTRDVQRMSTVHARAEGETRLEEVKAQLETHGFSCTSEVVAGPLFESVSQAVEALRPDRIYMSRSKLGPFARLFGERDVARLARLFGDKLILREETEPDAC